VGTVFEQSHELQELFDVIALLRVRGKLTRKFLATMLT